jgi:aspartyl-tRNA(Asn)/glutamyl-tRNA(Gln) amidotransferase subunit A
MITAPDTRSIAAVAPLVASRTLSPTALVESCLASIDARRDGNAFITVLREQALQEAARASDAIAAGGYLGPLHGIPIALKDLVDVAGTPTTAGSRVPAAAAASDAAVTRLLRRAGAIVIGKTNLHEFAFGTTSDETAFGPVRHPDDPARSAGGSSGGSAAALVEGMCFGAVGTDTGGSIRIPGACCGIVGLKPTIGEISIDGVVPLSTTFDHVGPMARSVADAALLFQIMKGSAVQPIAAANGTLRFGVPRAYFFDLLDAGVRAAIDSVVSKLRAAGHAAADVTVAHASCTADVYLHITLPEASCFHAPMLDAHADKYSPGVRLRLEMGRYLLAEDYVRAMRLRARLTEAVDRALDRCDALLLPALAIPAPPIGAATVDVDGIQAPVRATMLRLTQLFNMTGHPAIALPAGRGGDGLPRGLQLVGRRGETERLLAIAAAVEGVIRVD